MTRGSGPRLSRILEKNRIPPFTWPQPSSYSSLQEAPFLVLHLDQTAELLLRAMVENPDLLGRQVQGRGDFGDRATFYPVQVEHPVAARGDLLAQRIEYPVHQHAPPLQLVFERRLAGRAEERDFQLGGQSVQGMPGAAANQVGGFALNQAIEPGAKPAAVGVRAESSQSRDERDPDLLDAVVEVYRARTTRDGQAPNEGIIDPVKLVPGRE